MMENMGSDSAKLCCCMICFVFIFIILVIAICWTNYDTFENFGNIIKYNQETMTNVLTGGVHYLSLNPNDNVLAKFNNLKKKKQTALVVITAPWCGYCKKLKSSGVLKKIAGKYPVLVIDDKHPQTQDLMHLLQAEGFPALGIFGHGKLFSYKGARTSDSIIPIMNKLAQTSKNPGKEHFTSGKEGKLIKVPEQANEKELMYLIDKYNKEGYNKICTVFLADWCGHCKNMKKEKTLEKMASNGVIVFVISDESPLSKTMGVRGFPTIFCWKGTKKVQYEGEREASKLINFMDSM